MALSLPASFMNWVTTTHQRQSWARWTLELLIWLTQQKLTCAVLRKRRAVRDQGFLMAGQDLRETSRHM